MSLQWRSQFWQSLEEGAGKRYWECEGTLHAEAVAVTPAVMTIPSSALCQCNDLHRRRLHSCPLATSGLCNSLYTKVMRAGITYSHRGTTRARTLHIYKFTEASAP